MLDPRVTLVLCFSYVLPRYALYIYLSLRLAKGFEDKDLC